jgi:AraC-like DNA-binding protein
MQKSRMELTKYISRNPYIDFFFFVQSEDVLFERKEIKFFPDGKSVIVFNLENNFIKNNQKLPHHLLSAICMEPHLLKPPNGKIDLIGIQFKAHGLYPFISIAIKEIAAQIHSLELLFGSELNELEGKLIENLDTYKRMELLENFFQKKAKKTVPTQVETLINDINIQKGCVSVAQLAQKYSVSERTIERIFETYLGINPKKYIRLVRFLGTVDVLKNGSIPSLTSLAYDFGYADHSHFIKEFQEFAQLKPSIFQKNMPLSDFYNFEL